jgi:thiaminase
MISPISLLTQHLLNSNKDAFQIATQCKFLEQAGKGTLKKEILQKWLGQDRLYAQAYIRFASILLADILLPSVVNPGSVSER